MSFVPSKHRGQGSMVQFEFLCDKLRSADVLKEADIKKACEQFHQKRLSREQFFLESGKHSDRIGFLEEGILCSYINNDNGEMVVKHFIEEGEFFTDLDSYELGTPADLNIQAITDSSILFITRSDYKALAKEIPAWPQTMGIISSRALNNMIRTQHFLHIGSAVDKYKYFIKHHPALIREVPLKYIAAYLGITQSSLSRIRKDIS